MPDRTPDASDLARRLARAGQSGSNPESLAALMVEVDALFAVHQHRVYAVCLRFAGKPELAMELAQDSMLRAYEKLPGFRGEARFSTWLMAIARYECLNAMRKRGELLTEDGVIEATAPQASALGTLRRREREALLHEAAASVLDPVEQEAVHLRYSEYLPLDEIDRLLELEIASGARGVLQRCKRKLGREIRRILAERGHGSSFLRASGDE